MPLRSSTAATQVFQFTATEGDWEELLKQLNEFAKMVQTDLQVERVTCKELILVPIPGPTKQAEAPLGMVFCRKANFDSENVSHPSTTAIHQVIENADAVYGRQIVRVQMQTPTYDGVVGGLK